MLLAIFTRSLPCVRRGYCICKTAPKLRPTQSSFCICRHLFFQRLLFRPAINLIRNVPLKKRDWCKLFVPQSFTSSVAVARSHPFTSSLARQFPVCGGCSMPQHRHPFTKKSFLPMLINNAFFCSLGVFIVLSQTNALGLFAHFFRRKPTGFCLKRKLCFLAFFQKNRAQV